MDPTLVHDLVPAVVGGTAGFIGGAVAALARETNVRRVLTAVLGGMGLGAFVAPILVRWVGLPVEAAGAMGFIGGLGVFGVVEGVERLSDRFGKNPEVVLPAAVRDRLPAVPPAPVPAPAAPPRPPSVPAQDHPHEDRP